MKKLILFTLLFFTALSSFATERELSLTLTSNYVFRGVTQTADKAAVQANYQLSQNKDSGFYAGFFASNVSAGAEVDVFGGLKFKFGNSALEMDIGAIEYLYTDNKFKDFYHELYAGLQYEKSYIKYYFGEKEARYLDIGTGFTVLGSLDLLLHFGEVFNSTDNGNDFSISLQKEFSSVVLGATATYEDKTVDKKSKLFAFIKKSF
ncbi:MAG: TorF family putative porin [Gammaproteobacteria bacterium]|nr:TorF family putative porin [Gammaproteobacteria bacterium]